MGSPQEAAALSVWLRSMRLIHCASHRFPTKKRALLAGYTDAAADAPRTRLTEMLTRCNRDATTPSCPRTSSTSVRLSTQLTRAATEQSGSAISAPRDVHKAGDIRSSPQALASSRLRGQRIRLPRKLVLKPPLKGHRVDDESVHEEVGASCGDPIWRRPYRTDRGPRRWRRWVQ